ncbi:MAG: hypothetical protein Q8O88_04175 [bacterium]|nr:hypothetical protein [bacterium]
MIKQTPEPKECISQFLSTDQAKLLAEHISKETKWDENDGVKTQTYSKYQKFGSSKPLEFPLWANMVAKKLYYEKAVDFVPDEVTIVEQDCHSDKGMNAILNKLSEVPGKAVAVVLEILSGIKPGSLVTSESYVSDKNKKFTDGGRMMAILFMKN